MGGLCSKKEEKMSACQLLWFFSTALFYGYKKCVLSVKRACMPSLVVVAWIMASVVVRFGALLEKFVVLFPVLLLFLFFDHFIG